MIELDGRREPTFIWFGTRGLFDPVCDFIRGYVGDPALREKLNRDVASGYLFLDQWSAAPRAEVLRALREDLVPWVDTVQYPPPLDVRNHQDLMAARIKNLARMAWRLEFEDAAEGTATVAMSEQDVAVVADDVWPRLVSLLQEHVGEAAVRLLLEPENRVLDLGRAPEATRRRALRVLIDKVADLAPGGDGRVLAQMAGAVVAPYPAELTPWPPRMPGHG